MCLLGCCYGCATTSSMTAKTEQCVTTPTSTTCSFFEETLLSAASGSITCLQMKSNVGTPLGSIQMKAELLHECEPLFAFRTHPAFFVTTTVERCMLAGSCDPGACGDTSWNSTIDEFGVLNNITGVTRCEDSCGCFLCGCFFCDSACLFSRTNVQVINLTFTLF